MAGIPIDLVDLARPKFHPDFPYEHKHWRDRTIIVSDDETHFHVPLKSLARRSTVFAAAACLPVPPFASILPIPLLFAPQTALVYILSTLRDLDKDDAASLTGRLITPEVVLAAARIAHVLDIPMVGKVIRASQNLDVYLRYAIGHMFGAVHNDSTSSPVRVKGLDLSFSLFPVSQYRRAADLLSEANPSALVQLAKFYHRRLTALAILRQWWTTGIALGRVLRSDLPPKIVHKRYCQARKDTEAQFRRHLIPIALLALGDLARATTLDARTKGVKSVVTTQARGCRGCLNKLEAVFMPALRVFNASFPASPA